MKLGLLVYRCWARLSSWPGLVITVPAQSNPLISTVLLKHMLFYTVYILLHVENMEKWIYSTF